MYIVLPNADDGWKKVEEKLQSLGVQQLFDLKQSWDFLVEMPRWEMDQEVNSIQKRLQAMGLRSLFSNEADFSGLSNERIEISNVVHQVKIRVDEEVRSGSAGFPEQVTTHK